ncbi:MAG: gfo/Idh/MocA family oxidoreductase, partial [Armatimonadota bacterium]
GPGCESVSCAWTEDFEVVTGRWDDGRIGTVRGVRAGASGYTFCVWGENGTRSEPLDRTYNHRELLTRIVQFFETGESPVDPLETLEVIAFIAAALESRERDGRWISLYL